MGFPVNTLPPHRAVAHLSPKERLSVPYPHRPCSKLTYNKPTSPLPLGEEQGEGLGYLWGRLKLFFLLILTMLFTSTASAQEQTLRRIISPQADTTALTIYPKNLALITESRMIDLPVGKSTIVFEGVNDRMIPASVLLRQFEGLTIERNFDAELLSKANLFERSVGETVTLTRTDKSSGIVRQVRATIISAGNGVVFDIGGKLETYQCSGLSENTLFSNIPEGLNNKPELSIDVDTTTSGPRELVISYLADGFSWAADYRLDMTSETTAKFNAWLTFKNETSQNFKDTQTSVVAGSLNRSRQTRSPQKQRKNLVANCWPRQSTKTPIPVVEFKQNRDEVFVTANRISASVGLTDRVASAPVMMKQAEAAPPPPEQEDLSEYKLYRMPEPINVASYQTKQIRFLHEPEVEVEQVYTFEESWRSLLNPDQPLRPAIMETRLDNSKDGKLAKPLPSGTYRVMSRSKDGKPLIHGEDTIDNRAIDLPVKIKTNLSRNVQMQTRITVAGDGVVIGNSNWNNIKTLNKVEHIFTNAHNIPVTIEFRATGHPQFQHKSSYENGIYRYGQVLMGYNGAPYEVINPSIKPDEDEATPTWTFVVPANSTVVLSYRAEVQ